MMAHCSKLAPGGVSQLICQSPYCALTTPCAERRPAASATAPAASAESGRDDAAQIRFTDVHSPDVRGALRRLRLSSS